MFPFDLKGDLKGLAPCSEQIKISCVINFYGRLDLLKGILYSLARQDFPREFFEVVLVEDQGGTDAGSEMCESFLDQFQIVYRALDKNFGKMGYSRNFGLAQTTGKIVLFLDDDTVLLQTDFLKKLADVFNKRPQVDAIIPHGFASFALVEDRYDFHDPYFMTSRCMAYRRIVLESLGGFMSHFVGQEDVEFVVRFTMAGKKAERCAALEYFHPPLLVPNSNKSKAVGASFCQLKGRYPLLLWLLTLVNCSRHALLIFLPARHQKEMGRFGWGVIKGIWECMLGKKDFKYS
jgi:glycosyltransferase involved in cell wall biosynthesis